MVRSVALARSRSPRRRGASPLAAWLAASALLFGQSATIVHADQTINTAVTGAQYGDGGTFTITSSGSVTNGSGRAVTSTSGQAITTFVNDGVASAYTDALFNDATSMTAITNSGTMSGLAGLYSTGTIGTFTNQSTGSISAYNYPVVVTGLGSGIGSLTNSGSIVNTGGGNAIVANDQSVIGTLTNTVSGSIQGGYSNGLSVYNSQLGTLSNAGSITGPDRGIYVSGASASIATLTNSGTASGGLVGITAEGGTIGSLTNLATGMIQGTAYDGIQNIAGTITTIDNSGGVNGLGRSGIRNEEYNGNAHIGTITNRAGATVSGVDYGIGNVSYGTGHTATIDLIDNAGTLSGASHGVYSNGAVTTLTNSGTVSGGTRGVVLYSPSGTLSLLDNSGRIEATNYASYGVQVEGGTLTTLTNSGTIVGDWNGVRTDYYATISTVTNGATGMIQGTSYDGIINVGSEMTTIDNSGVISGPRSGILNADLSFNAHIGTITNRAGASILGDTAGIYNDQEFGNVCTIDSIDNAGSIFGLDFGVYNYLGTITAIDNSGTILGGSGAVLNAGTLGSLDNSGTVGDVFNSGVVQTVTNTGQFGDLLNVGAIGTGSGTVISSTGAGASIGEIHNLGTISGGVTIENQDLVVHGNTFPTFGVFENGTINIKNGSLTFADGGTFLDSDVVVSSLAGTAGAGTMTNQGELILGTTRNLDGSFTQSSAGVLTLLVSGTLPGEFGALVGTGLAQIDGTLNLEEYTPLADGQSFTFLSFASAVGTFASLAVDGTLLSSLGGGQWAYGSLILTEAWTGGIYSIGVTQAAVPEIDPAGLGSVVSLLLGALALAERRRGRKRGC